MYISMDGWIKCIQERSLTMLPVTLGIRNRFIWMGNYSKRTY